MLAVNIIIYREINMKERKLQGGFISHYHLTHN